MIEHCESSRNVRGEGSSEMATRLKSAVAQHSEAEDKTQDALEELCSNRIESNRIQWNDCLAKIWILNQQYCIRTVDLFAGCTGLSVCEITTRTASPRSQSEANRNRKRSGNKCLMEARSRNKPKPMNAWFACVLLLTNRATELQRRPVRVEANACRSECEENAWQVTDGETKEPTSKHWPQAWTHTTEP